jgi:hypothetical protein
MTLMMKIAEYCDDVLCTCLLLLGMMEYSADEW